MRQVIKKINIFFISLITPIIGMVIVFDVHNHDEKSSITGFYELEQDLSSISLVLETTNNSVDDIKLPVQSMLTDAATLNSESALQINDINNFIASSAYQTEQSDVVLEQVLSNLLGEPIETHSGVNSTIKIYSLEGVDYRGYMAKITPHTSEAIKIVLADDKITSNGEKTSAAAKRIGGILAVNAGGFWANEYGQIAPVGITVVDGIVKQFSTQGELTFVGFDYFGKLIGADYQTEAEIYADNILQGASFKPTLLENGEKVDIPSTWAKAKHPRTIIGSFSNDDILIIVIDGRNYKWSKGVTLEEVQDKLLSFKIKNAYNLDGGGSSTIYYDGEILNKPSDGNERSVTTNLVIMP